MRDRSDAFNANGVMVVEPAAPPARPRPPAGVRADAATFDALSALLAYPGERFEAIVSTARAALAPQPGVVREAFEAFAGALGALPPAAREELYTATFEVKAACALEIGWQLFGEDYHRGLFLTRMRAELRVQQLPEGSELPDHLTSVLRLIPRMAPPARAARFVSACVLPALGEMLDALPAEHPYAPLLDAVHSVVAAHGAPEASDG